MLLISRRNLFGMLGLAAVGRAASVTQLMQPAELAGRLGHSARPIFQIGFEALFHGAHIPGSVYAGPGTKPEVLLAAVAGLATSTFLIAREQGATAKALQAETGAKDDLRRDVYFHCITLAHQDLTADNLGGALKLLEGEGCPKDLRQWEWFYLMRLCRV